MEIIPWVVADCDLLFTDKPYCRNFAVKNSVMNIRIEDVYGKLGLDSSLGPSIDKIDIDKNCKGDTPSLLIAVKRMNRLNHLPVLKHFLYQSEISDVHDKTYVDERSLEKIKELAYCYYAINDLNLPFAIMPTHFYFSAIDAKNIAIHLSLQNPNVVM